MGWAPTVEAHAVETSRLRHPPHPLLAILRANDFFALNCARARVRCHGGAVCTELVAGQQSAPYALTCGGRCLPPPTSLYWSPDWSVSWLPSGHETGQPRPVRDSRNPQNEGLWRPGGHAPARSRRWLDLRCS